MYYLKCVDLFEQARGWDNYLILRPKISSYSLNS